jgi:hypothetical protein
MTQAVACLPCLPGTLRFNLLYRGGVGGGKAGPSPWLPVLTTFSLLIEHTPAIMLFIFVLNYPASGVLLQGLKRNYTFKLS